MKKEDSVYIEGRQHGDYSYPNLLVNMHKLDYSNDVGKAAQRLGFSVKNTGKEQDGYRYIGKIQPEQAINLVKELNYVPINLRLFVDFLSEIESGLNGKKSVYNGSGNIISKDRLQIVWDEITGIKRCWRGELFDNLFSKKGKQLYLTYHKIKNDKTLERVTEPVEACLMQDKTPGVDIDYWLRSATKQGLPQKKIPNGSLYFWYPRDKCFAGFDACFGRASLGCDKHSIGRDSSLGVRVAKIIDANNYTI